MQMKTISPTVCLRGFVFTKQRDEGSVKSFRPESRMEMWSCRQETNGANEILIELISINFYLKNLINNGGNNNNSGEGGGGGGTYSSMGISTVHDMIKEMKVDFAPLEGIAPTPRNELAYNPNELPNKHKVRGGTTQPNQYN